MRGPQQRGGMPATPRSPIEHLSHSTHFRGRQHVAAILVVVTLALVAFRMFPGKDVVVLNDGQTMHVRATFDPRGEALAAANVELEPSDRVLYASTADQASVAVQRARSVNIEVDGQSLSLHTQAETVAGSLAAAGIELRPGDQVFVNRTRVTERAPLDAVIKVVTALETRERALDILSMDYSAEIPAPTISVVRAQPITVLFDSREMVHNTAAPTVDEALRDMGILVKEGDLVQPGFDTPVTSGMEIRIAKARNVTVLLNGVQNTMITQSKSVADVLRVLEIEPRPEDIVTPAAETALVDGMTITIALTRVVEEEALEPIPPTVTYVNDPSMRQGETRVEQGVEGVRSAIYRVTYKNGVETGRELVSSEVIQAATPTRYITGSAAPVNPSQPPVQSIQAPGFSGSYSDKLTVWATWYNATHGGKAPSDPWYGYTATGVRLDKGICATDPNVIPMGTWMYIPGYGTCLAADVGGGVKGNHIDLGFPESAGSNPWATQTLEIYILE